MNDPILRSEPSGPADVEFEPPAAQLDEGRYAVRFARDAEALDAALRLRFEVFNVELGEGLEESWRSGRDRDAFDDVCHHLIVDHQQTGEIVGTYRLQTAAMARRSGLGFYSDGEFDLAGLPAEIVDHAIEVGRACVAFEHRNTQVLFLLWKGLALYLATHRLRYLFGCCSLTSQDPAEGWALHRDLNAQGHVHPAIHVAPRPEVALDPVEPPSDLTIKVPKLFRTYLRHRAQVCGPPAIDRDFKTIDWLVLLDVDRLDDKRRRAFFGP
ncbi:MAG: GNAT family N-acyltransferase [Acidobacteriota bacterium]